MFSSYVSPLATRYASHEMVELFSPLSTARTWRRVWLALAEAELEVGAPVTEEQVAAMRATIDQVDLGRVAEIEAETRHEVVAHIRAWGEICPVARPVIHLGATSQFVIDNAESLITRQAIQIIQGRLVNLLRALSNFAQAERDRPALGYTHFQPAQLVTMGKRACLWLHDLVLDLTDLSNRLEELPCRGAKGTTGTQASYLDLLGSSKKVEALDQRLAEALGFPRAALITGQTLSRKHDLRLFDALSGLAMSLAKYGRDVRLLMHTGELREPFKPNQVGSSAMPYKRNPMLAERLCALARLVMHHRNCIAEMAASQWLERSLDDSATRRITIPAAFLAIDGALRVAYELSAGLRVDIRATEARVAQHLPFLCVERLIAEVVKAGGDRQAAHERVREHAMAWYDDPETPFVERLTADPQFAKVTERLGELLDPAGLVGRAPEQVDAFLRDTLRPLLQSFSDVPAMTDSLTV